MSGLVQCIVAIRRPPATILTAQMRLVNSLKELRQRYPWMALGIALAIFLVAFLLRYSMGDVMKDVPFITLFPAIVLAALVGGLEVGLVIAALSGLVGWYFFLPPENSCWNGRADRSL